MSKKLNFVLFAVLAMFLILSCAPKPAATEEKKTAEMPAIREAPVDAVAEDISEVGNADERLDTSELDGVDSILEDIENI